jgi:hypothetical protein
MKPAIAIAAITTLLGVPCWAQQQKPTIYNTPTGDGFEVYLAAAMQKKEVPVAVLDHEDGATYTLKTARFGRPEPARPSESAFDVGMGLTSTI